MKMTWFLEEAPLLETTKILQDYHMHTSFSCDSKAKPEEMIKSAIAKGLTSISITDHYDLECIDYKEDETFDSKDYFATLLPLKEKYKDKIAINIGVELGLQPGCGKVFLPLVKNNPFEFIIGSVHVFKGRDLAKGEVFIGRREEDVYPEYFEEVLQNIKEYKKFNVLGHLDYPIRYSKGKNTTYHYKNHKEVLDDILKELIDTGRGLEVNAAGLKYGLPFAHPRQEILKRYVELGGEILTIGSDAHRPNHIAYDYERVKEYLKSCNVKNYTIFSSSGINFYQLT